MTGRERRFKGRVEIRLKESPRKEGDPPFIKASYLREARRIRLVEELYKKPLERTGEWNSSLSLTLLKPMRGLKRLHPSKFAKFKTLSSNIEPETIEQVTPRSHMHLERGERRQIEDNRATNKIDGRIVTEVEASDTKRLVTEDEISDVKIPIKQDEASDIKIPIKQDEAEDVKAPIKQDEAEEIWSSDARRSSVKIEPDLDSWPGPESN